MGALDRQDVMECRNWRAGSCPRSDPVVLEESSENVQMGCRTCRGGWIVTLPVGRARARYENRLAAIREAERRRRAAEAQPVIFT